MAQIIAALATSHGPLLTIPPDQWYLRERADRAKSDHWYRGKQYDFDALAAARAPGFADQATDEVKRERYDACQRALDELNRHFRAAEVDLAIVLGNDQSEVFHDDLTATFAIYHGATIPSIPFTEAMKTGMSPGVALAESGHTPPDGATWPGAPGAANTLIASLIADDFDVARSARIPSRDGKPLGIPHAFGFVYRRLMGDAPPPSIPIFTNVGEGTNTPRLARVLAFGHALKRAIDALPAGLRVGIVASGGLTHFCVDEEFDRTVLAAMQARDEAALAALPESYFYGNTCEIKSWFALAACMNDCGMSMRMIDYVPCYRSVAGTGSAMGFAVWE